MLCWLVQYKHPLTTPSKNNKALYVYIIMIGIIMMLLFFASIRALSVGSDMTYYGNHFRWMRSGSIFHRFEPAYQMLVFIITQFTDNFRVLLIACAILTTVPYVFVTFKEANHEYLWLAILSMLMFYFYSFSILRAALALGACVLAFYFIDKPGKRFLLVASAILTVSFHYQSVIFIAALFILNRRLNLFWYVWGALATVFFALSGPLIRDYLVHLSPRMLMYFNHNFRLAPVNIALFGVLCILSYIYYKPMVNKRRKNALLINMNVAMLMFNIGFYWIPIYGRIVQQFRFLSVFLLIEIIKCEPNKYWKVFFIFSYVLYCLYAIYSVFHSSNLLPYKFIWS